MHKRIITTALISMLIFTGCTKITTFFSAPTTASKPSASAGLYAYETLKSEEKKIYDAMYEALIRQEESFFLPNIPDQEMKQIFLYVLKDHPELFWCNAFERQNTQGKAKITPVYRMPIEERQEYESKIKAETAKYVVPADTSDYAKAKHIYDLLINETEYGENPNDQNILSVFIDHQSVCSGYAKAFQYLLKQAGILATCVSGKAGGAPHAWNLVKLNNKLCYFDVTWGDPSYINDENGIDYSYFGVPFDDISKTHTVTDSLTLPTCDTNENTYFANEGLFCSDIQTAEQIFATKFNGHATIKFKTKKLYDDATNYFITQKHLFDYISQRRVITYSNDDLYIINIKTKE